MWELTIGTPKAHAGDRKVFYAIRHWELGGGGVRRFAVLIDLRIISFYFQVKRIAWRYRFRVWQERRRINKAGEKDKGI
jgi:hypothetical protein